LSALAVTLLLIEFLDEFVYGAGEAAWPLIRADLHLSYTHIGVLLSVPRLFGNLVEPSLGILSDVWRRRALILGGGVFFAVALTLTAASQSFWPLLLAFMLFNPASGAYVSLSQAALMDSAPDRHEHNMARWTFAGSVGVVAGPLALIAAVAAGLGWRGLYLVFAGLAVILLVRTWPLPLNVRNCGESSGLGDANGPGQPPHTFREGLQQAVQALRRGAVVRWLVLLEAGDLMLDVLYSFLALYFVDVVGVSAQTAGLAVAVWTGVGLVGDFALIPLLERVPGLVYLRASAAVMLILFPAFLLVPPLAAKLVLLGALGLLNAGWYAILMAQLYSTMPNQSGTVLAVNNVSGLAGSVIPLGLGVIAHSAGLHVAMWLLIAGPVALLVGLPRVYSREPDAREDAT
jgi:FSR family fosmidomycin resistance protein-like MFS transporter